MKNKAYEALIINKSNVMGYITDIETDELLYITKGCLEELSINSGEDYQHKKCYEILQGLDKPCPFCTNSIIKENVNHQWEHYNEKLKKWFNVSDTMMMIDGKKCRIEYIQDITEQKERIRTLNTKIKNEEAILDCIKILSHASENENAINDFLERIGKFYDANRSYIFQFFGNIMNNTYEWCKEGISTEIENLQNIPVDFVKDWIDKFDKGGEFFISSLNEELDKNSPDYKILKAQNIESLIASPLIVDNLIVGFIGVDDPKMNCDNLTLLRASADFAVEELTRIGLLKELEYANYTDMLTGVKNRLQYINTLKKYTYSKPSSIGVVFADVNGMKRINDTYGHNWGDRVLSKVATILRQFTDNHIYRIGGDEFVAFFENVEQDEFYNTVDIIKSKINDNEDCNISIGFVWGNGDVNVENLISMADDMMYAEKQEYYHNLINSNHEIRTGYATDVINEIANNKFLVYLQPQVRLSDKNIVGAEALVRKIDENGNIIAPYNFIEHYETIGVIRYVDFFVLETVCELLGQWIKKGIELKVSVNFSRVTLMENNVLESVCHICDRYGVKYKNIVIEVTESISKMDEGYLNKITNNFIQKGFTISLDDFGSKYSNLAILSSIKFGEIKFDKSVIDLIETNKSSQVIIENFINICNELNSTVSLAEGIETEGQYEMLKKFGCICGQGYYFYKPMPIEKFNRVVKDSLKLNK